ncbi:MAG: GAF domain-containing sensor histidine kinase [Deltaproteobacteria bacterium]|nr:GAF domain-containing sensor histidine kinase [Deltaproteobacteria bacterium]MCB9786371.1 GAF domain-containing sensor histidine kinase [Deltaproteobacteria bacterium]
MTQADSGVLATTQTALPGAEAGMAEATVSEMAHRIAELQAQLRLERLKLEGIEEISRALGSEHNIERILEIVMERTTELLDAERSTLFVVDEQSRTLWSRATQGGDVEVLEVPLGHGIAGWVAEHGRSVNVKDAYKDPRFDGSQDQKTGYRTRSMVCAPLRDSQQKLIGVIEVLNKRDGYFTPADEDLLAAIASQAAISIQNATLYVDIVGKNIDLLETSMRLEARTAEIELLFRVERAAATATTLPSALAALVDETLAEFPCGAAAVWLVDEARDAVLPAHASACDAAMLDGSDGSLGQEVASRVLASGECLRLPPRTAADGELAERIAAEPRWKVDHLVAVPIVHKDRRLGALILVNRAAGHRGFDDQDVRILQLITARFGLTVAIAHAQDEEHKAERLATIGQMLSSVLHDMKTPLTIIGGYARLMARTDEADKREAQREHIRRQIQQLKDMTVELLAFARGETEVLLRKVFVRDFLEDVRSQLAEEFADSGVELVVEAAYGGAVRMDETKMRRVIYNLARNGREAMAATGGTFSIRVEGDDTQVVFHFSDTGPGLPDAIRGRLFEPFATWGKKHGTGLGLAIVKKIVDEHRGTISVDSEPGRGTTFSITIPSAD